MRIGIISDIHEDILSLKEGIKTLEQNDCNELVCLGDITGYDRIYNKKIKNPNASACISIIRSNFKYVVAGNHDLYSIKKLPSKIPNFHFPNNWYFLDINERKRLGGGYIWLYENETPSSKLTRKDKEFLDSLPEYIIEQFGNYKLFLSHSVYPDLSGSLIFRPYNPWNLTKHFDFIQKKSCNLSFSGHMHPAGFVRADINNLKLLSFRTYKIRDKQVHYFCPCIAGDSNKNGIIIIDFNEKIIKALKLNKKHKFSIFYEWLQS